MLALGLACKCSPRRPLSPQVLALGKPTVLVLTNGGALAIDVLVSRAEPAPYAIVEAFNPNQIGAAALGETLFGGANRWGKLPVTMYEHAFISKKEMTDFDMSSGVGRTYRYYTGMPLYPFGFGLSYTQFHLTCQASAARRYGTPAGAANYSYACTVMNQGSISGDEVLMLYHSVGDAIRAQLDHPAPRRALIDFQRLSVVPGARASHRFELSEKDLMIVNANGEKVLYPGEHHLVFARGAAGVNDDDATFIVQA